jgi:hypothetical protein
MPCYSSNTTLAASAVDDSEGVIYYASLEQLSTIRFTFSPPSGGSITSVTCSPPGPTTGTDYVEFVGTHAGNAYVVTVVFTTSSRESDSDSDGHVSPLETPTKVPTFKPVVRCPS